MGRINVEGQSSDSPLLYATGEVPVEENVWADILEIRESLLSRKSAQQYIGFASAQRMRLTGERGTGRHGQRPDLVEKYGYYTKFAMHYVRLLYECKELLSRKRLTLPLPEKDLLISSRTGQFTKSEVLAMGAELETECQRLLNTSDLPEEPDRQLFCTAIAKAYRDHWDRHP